MAMYFGSSFGSLPIHAGTPYQTLSPPGSHSPLQLYPNNDLVAAPNQYSYPYPAQELEMLNMTAPEVGWNARRASQDGRAPSLLSNSREVGPDPKRRERERAQQNEEPVERVVYKIIEEITEVTEEVKKEIITEVPTYRYHEKIVDYPVEKIHEKIIEKAIAQYYQVKKEVPVERVVYVEVPVDRVVEKIVEEDVQQIVERVVEVPIERIVHIEVPVDKIMENIIPMQPINPSKVGIGLLLEQNDIDKKTTVQRILPGFGAHHNGCFSIGDLVVAVDDIDVRNLSLDVIKNLIVGPEGSSLILKILRGGNQLYTATVVRIIPLDAPRTY